MHSPFTGLDKVIEVAVIAPVSSAVPEALAHRPVFTAEDAAVLVVVYVVESVTVTVDGVVEVDPWAPEVVADPEPVTPWRLTVGSTVIVDPDTAVTLPATILLREAVGTAGLTLAGRSRRADPPGRWAELPHPSAAGRSARHRWASARSPLLRGPLLRGARHPPATTKPPPPKPPPPKAVHSPFTAGVMATVPAVSESDEPDAGADVVVVAEPLVPEVRGAIATTQLPTFTSASAASVVWSKVVLAVQVTVVWLSVDCTWMVFPSTDAISPEAPGRVVPPPLPVPVPPCPPAPCPAAPSVTWPPPAVVVAARSRSSDELPHAARATASRDGERGDGQQQADRPTVARSAGVQGVSFQIMGVQGGHSERRASIGASRAARVAG